MKILENITKNLPELNLENMRNEAEAFKELLLSMHSSIIYLALAFFLIGMMVLIYFQFIKDKTYLFPVTVKRTKSLLLKVIVIIPLLIWLGGSLYIHKQIDNFFDSNLDVEKINSFNKVAPLLPNFRYYLFCEKQPVESYRLSLTQLNDLLPAGVGNIEDFTIDELNEGKDKIRDKFIIYSYKRSLLPGLAVIIIFVLAVLGFFRFMRIKYNL